MTDLEIIKGSIRAIPDFPKPGILFRDITTLISNPRAFKLTINAMIEAAKEAGATKIVAIESRGFILGAPMATAMDLPLIIVRKPGKLPGAVVREEYTLEYGTDALEIHEGAVENGDRVVIVDDLLATGGTARAVGNLVSKLGAQVGAWLFTVELDGLGGREALSSSIPDAQIISLVSYE